MVQKQGATTEQARRDGQARAEPPAAPDGSLALLWDGLPPAVTEKLSQPLEPALVSHRKGRGGNVFPYLEGHAAIAQANRVFGYGGWGYELVGEVTYKEVKSVEPKTGEVATTGMYFATVQVTVPGVPPRTDVGCQAVADETPEGRDTAYKGAVTDALKRALRSFGDQFGNALYGDGADDALLPPLKEALVHMASAQGLAEQKLREAVKQKTGKELDALAAPEVAEILQAMARKLAQARAEGSSPRSSAASGQ